MEQNNQMAADLHLIAMPFRVIGNFIKLTLFLLSLPLICGAGLLSYALGKGFDPFASFMTWANAHPASWLSYPFYVLVGILALAAKMLLMVGHDCGGLFALILSVPFVGAVLAALVASWWYIVVRAAYCGIDHKHQSRGKYFMLAVIGFVVAFVIALYASEVSMIVSPDTESGAAVIFSLGTLTIASPSLIYMLWRGLKPSNDTV